LDHLGERSAGVALIAELVNRGPVCMQLRIVKAEIGRTGIAERVSDLLGSWLTGSWQATVLVEHAPPC
jgi:hypothetical protein